MINSDVRSQAFLDIVPSKLVTPNVLSAVLRTAPATWCTPGMGVNLWGASPLYMNPTIVARQQTKN